ncbi:MAG: hypothetical protein AB2L24_24405 [Mangrovibacterium sp.]
MNSIIVKEEKDNVSIENHLTRFIFNLRKGEYSISDKRDGREKISEASFGINGYKSSEYGNYNWQVDNIEDELGNGRKITLTAKKEGKPTLIFEVYMYLDKGCVVLNCGLENTTNQELRVMSFYPLQGRAFQRFDLTGYKTLDGYNGEENTEVSEKDTLSCNDNLLVTFGKKREQKHSLVIGGLTYYEFRKFAKVIKHGDFLEARVWSEDPVGRLIDPHSKYIFKDKFYIDFSIDNRFEILEQYGFALREANHVDLGDLNYPILNFWCTFTEHFAGDEFKNTTVGTVEKMEEVVRSGFLKYSPFGIRLEPDDYAVPNNQQGWWDDEHWQMYKSGQFVKPYETAQKWGHKITGLGGVPFIYFQTARRIEQIIV